MKKFYTIVFILAIAIAATAQSPVKKWQGTASDQWNTVDANWVPVEGLPFPAAFAQGDDVLIDDSRNEGADTLNVVGSIQAANISFNNSTSVTPYYITANDASSELFGDGAIYKENTGEVIVGVSTNMAGGIIARDGYYSANDATGTGLPFGSKVIFEGGSIKINYLSGDQPTYSPSFEMFVDQGQEATIVFPRRVYLGGKMSGSGTVNLSSNGERNFIGISGSKRNADWSEFSGQLNVEKGTEETSYTSGFYGLVLQTDSNYVFAYDDTTGTGVITETGVDKMFSNTKINIGTQSVLSSESGNRCYNIGELTGGEDSQIFGYYKKSDSPKIFYRVGSLNTDFTLASRFTGETGSGSSYRRYNYMGLIKVGTGIMRLTNPNNYITDMIAVEKGKLFVSNPEGSNTGTGYYQASTPLIVGPDGILGGTGSISRNVFVYGSLEPGEDGVGTLTIQDSLSAVGIDTVQQMFSVNIKPVGQLKMELASANSYDVLKADSFIVGGTLTIIPAATYDLKEGDTFKILDGAFSVASTVFDSISLPFTDKDWVWDTSGLYTNGTITLTAGGGSGTYDPENPDDPGNSEAINQYSVDKNILLFPNPNNGDFNIKLLHGTALSVKVLNALGRVAYQQSVNSSVFNVSLGDVISNGLYLVQIETTDGVTVRKIMVHK